MVALTSEIKTFLNDNIRSVKELEVLLFLRSHCTREWDGLSLATELNLGPTVASNLLMRLHLQGLIGYQELAGKSYRYRYSVHPKAKERRVSELAIAFEKAHSEVVDHIFTSQKAQLNDFADAFTFRRKE